MVSRAHRNAARRSVLEVEHDCLGELVVIRNLESVRGVHRYRISERLGAVGVARRGERADHNRIQRRVLCDRKARDSNASRGLVDVDHSNREHVLHSQTARVLARHRDRVAGRRLKVQRSRRPKRAVGRDRKRGRASECVGERVADVRVHSSEGADDRSDSRALKNRQRTERNGRRPLVDINNRDGHGAAEGEPALIRRDNSDSKRLLRLVVEHLGGHKLTSGDRKVGARVDVERIRQRVAGIRVRSGKHANGRIRGVVLGDRRSSDRDGRRRLVHVLHGDGERHRDEQAALISALERNRNRVCRLVIEGGRRDELIRLNGQECRASDRVRERVASVGIGGRDGRDDRPRRQVLCDRRLAQRDAGRHFVNVRDCDRPRHLDAETAVVRRLHQQRNRRRRLEVNVRSHLQLSARQREEVARVRGERVCERRTGVGVARRLRRANDRPRSRVLRNRARREANRRRRFVDVGD
eukprot:Opistho-1_new@57082